jgi:hypothetical protein
MIEGAVDGVDAFPVDAKRDRRQRALKLPPKKEGIYGAEVRSTANAF